jgi:hypothetical protein
MDMRKYVIVVLSFVIVFYTFGQNTPKIPQVYTNLEYTKSGELRYINTKKDLRTGPFKEDLRYTYSKVVIRPQGYEKGIKFDFKNEEMSGKIYYGFINHNDGAYHQAVYYKKHAVIEKGKAKIKLSKLKGKYDFINWEKTGQIRLGYRIQDDKGQLLYDGKINIKASESGFEPDVSIIEGPFVNKVTQDGFTITFKTNQATKAKILVGRRGFVEDKETTNHEIKVHSFQADTDYEYTIVYGDWQEKYHTHTAPESGKRKAFTFAYASDSRSGKGGGERDIFGANAYIMKKMTTLSAMKEAAFFQFTGDMISGYSSSEDKTDLEYTNWKRAMEPFWSYTPVYTSMGNHEAVIKEFEDWTSVDNFPFDTRSAEAVFQKHFCNFENGPQSEDNTYYDPDSKETNFPSYKETVYYYTYSNMAMIVMNSNYWYAPSHKNIDITGGNLHGYIMDQQLDWLRKTIKQLENNKHIDHIFVSMHTPAFPNGGHSNNDMWYHGDNQWRPYVAGKAVKKGIIERRDEILDILVNKSKKFVCLLAGDEHNYSRLLLTPHTNIYPKDWKGKKIKLNRKTWHIVNGAAGAPYYAQEELPWSPDVKIFSTQYALTLFHIDGDSITLEVINPDTLETIEEVVLKGKSSRK